MKGFSLVTDSNLNRLSQMFGTFYLRQQTQILFIYLWISPMVFVSALAEQLAKLLRQVRNKLKFYKEKLKYDCHKFFSTLKLEIYKNKMHSETAKCSTRCDQSRKCYKVM